MHEARTRDTPSTLSHAQSPPSGGAAAVSAGSFVSPFVVDGKGSEIEEETPHFAAALHGVAVEVVD